MAFSTSLLDERVTNIVAEETVLTATGQNDITGLPSTLHSATFANGSGQAAYIFFYDSRAGILGQTPTLTFFVPAGQTRTFNFPDGIIFSTGICVRCTNSEAQNSNTTPTGSPVVARFIAIRN